MELAASEFWSLTPYEFKLYAEAYQERSIEKYRVALFGAYNAEVFHRTKRLKGFSVYADRLNKRKQPKLQRQTVDQMKDTVRALAAAFGGKLENG